MIQKKHNKKRSGTVAMGGGLDTRIGGSTTPDFKRSPDTNIRHAGLEASNAQAGIADINISKSTASHHRGAAIHKKSTS